MARTWTLDSTLILSALCSPPCYFGMTENIREPWWKVWDTHRRRWYTCFRERKNRNVKLCGICLCRRQAWKWQLLEEANIAPIPLSIADRWLRNFPFNCKNRTNPKHLASYTICHIVSMHHNRDSFHPHTIAVKRIVHLQNSISVIIYSLLMLF